MGIKKTKVFTVAKNIALVAIICCIISEISSCTTINPYTGEQEANDSTIGVGIGVASGALIGGLANDGKGALIGAAIGGLAGGLIGHSLDNTNTELRQRLVGTGVQVKKHGNSVQLVMSSDVTFKTDSADINSGFYSTLSSVAVVLKKYRDTNVIIYGYTDNTGTLEHNQELSEMRAQSVGNFLISQHINRNRIFAQGFGQRNPVASNTTKAGRAQNRRVVITLRPR